MFRSTTNLRGRSFVEDDDSTAWLRMAARGIREEEPISFFTTNIPRDNDEFYPADSYCLCDSIKDNVSDSAKDDVNNNNIKHIPDLNFRARIYTVEEDTNNNNRTETKHTASKKKFDKKIKISRSLDIIELNGHKYKVHLRSRKVRSFDSVIDITFLWRCLCCHCPFDISVGVGAFVIGLSQISSFLSLQRKKTIEEVLNVSYKLGTPLEYYRPSRCS